MEFNSPGLNSGGGNRHGIAREWFCSVAVFKLLFQVADGEGMFYLDTEEVVPPFGEVTGEVPSGLSDDLHPNIVPRHPGHLAPVIHIILGFVQGVEVGNPAVTIVLACNKQPLISSRLHRRNSRTHPAKPAH